jgi:hypothetical protein
MFLCILAGCSSAEDDSGTITIAPLGNYLLSDIRIKRDSDAANYAKPDTITARTSYTVPPGQYYVYLEYTNLDSLASGWWQTTSDKTFAVQASDKWLITYGYDGGRVSEE